MLLALYTELMKNPDVMLAEFSRLDVNAITDTLGIPTTADEPDDAYNSILEEDEDEEDDSTVAPDDDESDGPASGREGEQSEPSGDGGPAPTDR